MALMSLIVAVPVNQLSASPKKGRQLLLIPLLETGIPLNEGFSEKLGGCLNEWLVRGVDAI